MFLLGLVCWTKYPKFMFTAWKVWMPWLWASGLHFLSPSWTWSLYQNVPIMLFHRASMLTNIPKIHVYSLKTLYARASGLYFPTPSWAWSLPWRWYEKVPIMFFIEAVCWPKYLKFMFTAWKLWMQGRQDYIFQHLLEHEACPEGGIKMYR